MLSANHGADTNSGDFHGGGGGGFRCNYNYNRNLIEAEKNMKQNYYFVNYIRVLSNYSIRNR